VPKGWQIAARESVSLCARRKLTAFIEHESAIRQQSLNRTVALKVIGLGVWKVAPPALHCPVARLISKSFLMSKLNRIETTGRAQGNFSPKLYARLSCHARELRRFAAAAQGGC
jgi:hypothetical protein